MLTRTLALVLAVGSMLSAQKLYMKDTPMDTAAEPNPDPGPMWVTEDIWVRTTPDPGYRPQPFAETAPPWTPLPHQNPEQRDPKYSTPNTSTWQLNWDRAQRLPGLVQMYICVESRIRTFAPGDNAGVTGRIGVRTVMAAA